MARIRTIKPEFWLDAKLALHLTRDQRLFYIGLWNQADDAGRFRANSRSLLGAIFPHDDDLTEEFIEDSLNAHVRLQTVRLYKVDDEWFGEVVQWKRHQKINRPSPSRLPANPNDVRMLGPLTERSLNDPLLHHEDSQPEQGTGNREQGTGSELGEDYVSEFEQFWNVGGKGPLLPAERAYYDHVPDQITHADLVIAYTAYKAQGHKHEMNTGNWISQSGYRDTTLSEVTAAVAGFEELSFEEGDDD